MSILGCCLGMKIKNFNAERKKRMFENDGSLERKYYEVLIRNECKVSDK